MAARTTPAPAHAPPSWTTRTWMVVRRRRWIWIILDLAGLLVAARAVSGGRAELLNGLGSLPRWTPIWLVPAVAAECCAFIALALAQRRILRAGGVNDTPDCVFDAAREPPGSRSRGGLAARRAPI